MSENLGKVLEGKTLDRIELVSDDTLPEIKGKAYILNEKAVSHSWKYIPLLHLVFAAENIGTRTGEHYRLGILGTWHLLKNAKSLCAYVGALDSDGELNNKLELILHRTVKRVVFVPEKLNLFLEFDNLIWLGIFHTEGRVSGFHFSQQHGYGLGGGGIDYFVQDGKVDMEWWIS